ncbi:MAG TPA: hypothetical protein VE267_12570 [Bradyrhizobium sp.]|nr:hypothetical protein [Bradyrhizobium sp.]
MQSVQPEKPMALRQSSHSMGTLVIRFVGLLTAAIVVMTLVWSV